MKVFLIRHAKAEAGEPDALRALNKRGREQARELGQRLARDGVHPDAVPRVLHRQVEGDGV